MAKLLRQPISGPTELRRLLALPETLVAPGAFDALSARLVEEAGFHAVYMTGFGASASRLGRPDVGLMTLTEMVDRAARIVEAVDIPLIADADTGYGNPINVIRTVQEYERVGVAGIHIEDQVTPKRCGHTEGKQVISQDEMVAKIRAATAARRSKEFVIIARTDARAIEGLERAVERAQLYREAGADVLFVEAPQSREEIDAIAARLSTVPLLFNWAEGGKTPPLTLDDIHASGFRIVIFPITTLLVATRAMREALAEIKAAGSPVNLTRPLPKFAEFLDFIGFSEIATLEREYGDNKHSA